jgi:hypothetical protein
MRKTIMAAAAIAALFAVPTLASAQDAAAGAATGAAVGAGAGFLLGGPVGAAIGAGVGGTVGAGAAADRREERVIVEEPAANVRERSCVRDSAGNESCTEIRR